MSDFFTFLGGGLVGGLAVAAFSAWRSAQENRISRQADYLARQIQFVYGPIHSLTEVNTSLRQRSEKLMKAVNDEYMTGPQDQSREAREAIEKHLADCSEIRNGYAATLLENHRRLIDILKENYSLVEIDDLAIFNTLILNHQLNSIEVLDTGGRTFPPRIYKHFTPDYSTPGLAQLVTRRYVEKANELAKLREHQTLCWQWARRRFHR